MLANSTTMGLLALYFCIVLGYEYTKIYAEEELDLAPMSGALLSMFAFFLSIPQLMVVDSSMERIIDQDNTIINDQAIGGDGVSRLGITEIFTGIIMAVLVVQLYRLYVVKNG